MLLGRYKQQPGERIKRIIDLDAWLEATEEIESVSVSVSPSGGLTVPTVTIDPAARKFAYYATGGTDGETYVATFTITTQTQVREDEIEIEVEEIN